jgi:predicted transcriptional regulator
MMRSRQKAKSWVEKKLADKKFKKGFMDEYAKLSIGEQLAALRQRANMTQAAVAKKAGTTASAISRYESASYDRYELQTLRRIVEACGGTLTITVMSSHNDAA